MDLTLKAKEVRLCSGSHSYRKLSKIRQALLTALFRRVTIKDDVPDERYGESAVVLVAVRHSYPADPGLNSRSMHLVGTSYDRLWQTDVRQGAQ
jgi:hypothetical protein